MAVKVPVTLSPVDTKRVDAALARIQSQAKGVNFGGGVRSLEKLSRPLGKITGQASEFQKSLEASNARVLAFGASVAVINKLSDAFGALVSNTIKVEASFAKIGVILGGTERELQQFGAGIFDVARKTATSFDQVAEGALELARQGLGVAESLARVETSLKLVRVAGIDSQQAVAGLTAAIKGFQDSGITVTEIADKLAEVDTKFAVSTDDLINGLERASASARVAGVSFDELLGLITTVQERTQRGGAVIGNAFKTIFARLGRTDTLAALQDLGIQVLDTEGNVRSAVPLFEELAVKLNELGLKSTQAGDIIQKVAGVRQRDILISLVEDLTSGQSQFAKSLQVSAGAAGALDAKNEKLNQTLEALINNVKVSGGELAALLGDIGFTDAAKDILETFNKVIGSIRETLQGDGIGSEFARGLVRGIGGILTGPGLALVTAIFIKLFIDLAKFGVSSLKSLLGINKAAEQQKILQQSVLQTLLQNENIQREILALEGNKVAQEQLLLKIYNQQALALSRVQKAAATVTPGLFAGGFRGGERGVTRRGAGGYIAAEARDVSRGVGGATSGSKVVSIPNFAFGGGKRGTMVANTSEYYVPNYKGGGDAIFNRDMIKTLGLPGGAKKINAAGGYIPNFSIATMKLGELTRAMGGKGFKQRLAAGKLTKDDKAMMNRRSELQGGMLVDPKQFVMVTPSNTPNYPAIGKAGSRNQGLGYTVAGFLSDSKIAARVDNDKQLDDATKKFAIDKAFEQSKLISNGRPRSKKANELANVGAISALSGAIFETAVDSIIASPDFDGKKDPNARFDFFGGQGLSKIFNLPEGATFIDAKIRNSPDMRKSMFSKIRKQLGMAASGYIPNFAAAPLEEAIMREQEAGAPLNQIRINQSGKLRSAQNPMGLAITNMKDEPTGKIPNFANGGGGKAASMLDKLSNNAGTLSIVFFGLQSALSGVEGGLAKFGQTVASALSVFTTLTLFSGPIGDASSKLLTFGDDIQAAGQLGSAGLKEFFPKLAAGGTGLAKTLGGASKGLGTLLKFAGPIGLAFSLLSPIIGKLIAPLDLFGTRAAAAAAALTDFEKNLKNMSGEQKESAKTEKEDRIAELQGRIELGEKGNKRRGRNAPKLTEAQQERRRDIGVAVGNLDANREELARLLKELPLLQKAIEQDASTTVGRELAESTGTVFAPEALTQVRADFAGISKASEGASSAAILAERLKLLKQTDELQKATTENTIKQLELDQKIKNERLAAVQSVTEQFLQETKLTGIQQTELDGIIAAIDGETTLADLKEKILNIDGLSSDARRKINNDIEDQTTALDKSSKIQQEQLDDTKALSTAEATKAQNIKNTNVDLQNQLRIQQRQSEFQKIADEARIATLNQELEGGPVSPRRKREIELEKQLIETRNTRAEATRKLEEAEASLAAERKLANEGADNEKALADAQLQVDIARERKDVIEATTKAQDDLNKKLSQQTGLDRGFKKLDQQILEFGDKLGEEIPNKFANELGTAMSEAVQGAKSIGDALSDAGRRFLGYIRDAALQQAAAAVTSGAGGFIRKYLPAALGAFFTAPGVTTPGAGAGGGGVIRQPYIPPPPPPSSPVIAFRGGLIPKLFNRGGAVGPDVIPAMLTPGEFIMSRDAVNKYGLGMLTKMNQGVMSMATMQNGGVIGPAPSPSASIENSSVNNNSEFTFNIQGGNTEQEGQGGSENEQQRAFSQRIREAVTTVVAEESRRGGSLSYLF